MRVERLNGYISLYRDLGLEEEDSNYHSGDCEDEDEDEEEFDDEALSVVDEVGGGRDRAPLGPPLLSQNFLL